MIGSALAFDATLFHLGSALLCLSLALCIQVGTNLANDYFDGLKGTDSGARLGPQRVTQSGLIAAKDVRRAFILIFIGAFLLGVRERTLGGDMSLIARTAAKFLTGQLRGGY